MSEPINADWIAELARLGVEMPAKAEVLSSAADSGGYRASVEILDGRGDPTGQTLDNIPLDRAWLGPDGAGWFRPPMPGRRVLVVWSEAVAGQPVIAASAEDEPPVPFAAVPAGAQSLQDGAGTEVRFHTDGRVLIRHRSGAEIATDTAGLWRIASAMQSLHVVLTRIITAGKEAETVLDTDTSSGSAGRELAMNAATMAAWDEAQAMLDVTLRP